MEDEMHWAGKLSVTFSVLGLLCLGLSACGGGGDEGSLTTPDRGGVVSPDGVGTDIGPQPDPGQDTDADRPDIPKDDGSPVKDDGGEPPDEGVDTGTDDGTPKDDGDSPKDDAPPPVDDGGDEGTDEGQDEGTDTETYVPPVCEVCNPVACECVHFPKTCDDHLVCTTDYCEPSQGCTYRAEDGCCDTDFECNAGDRCTISECGDDHKCDIVDAVDCDDGDECTIDFCYPASGCGYEPNLDPDVCPISCDADSQCEEAAPNCKTGACYPDSGFCVFEDRTCDDKNSCTVDSCDMKTGECVAGPYIDERTGEQVPCIPGPCVIDVD
jgi:hypothetical protein